MVISNDMLTTKCGHIQSLSINNDTLHPSNRQTLVYIPQNVCSTNTEQSRVVPILLTIHCLTCTASKYIRNFIDLADKYKMIIISPQGIENSWNGDNCCGASLANDYNDDEFISTAIHMIIEQINKLFINRIKLDIKYLFVVGFSNGGYMTDKLTWMSVNNKWLNIIASSPMAGYIYDNSLYISSQSTIKKQIPILFHHSFNDEVVHMKGCCQKECYCAKDICKASTFCHSLMDEFKKWLNWNKCDKYIDLENEFNNDLSTSNDFKCIYGTNCKHSTGVCLYNNNKHSDWAKKFINTEMIILFFMKSLCIHQNSIWNDDTNTCICSDQCTGFHCLTKTHPIQSESIINDHRTISYVTMLVVMIFISCIIVIWKQRNHPKRYHYSKLKTDDDL